jgi:predicted DNA repair protein MutK
LHDVEIALADMPALAWLVKALACAIAGLIIGFIVEKIVLLVKRFFPKKKG